MAFETQLNVRNVQSNRANFPGLEGHVRNQLYCSAILAARLNPAGVWGQRPWRMGRGAPSPLWIAGALTNEGSSMPLLPS
jgi:hypothetical protein